MHEFDTTGETLDLDQLFADLFGDIRQIWNGRDHANLLRLSEIDSTPEKTEKH
jgi:hypothetical protein